MCPSSQTAEVFIMSIPTCPVCGDILEQRETAPRICLLCQIRTVPAERAAVDRRLLGLLDGA
jgi:hypothetical protein